MNSSNTHTPRILGALAIAVIAGVSGYLFLKSNSTASTTDSVTPTTTSQTSTSTAAPASTVSPATSASTYKDGTYDATTSYRVPKGEQNSLKVTLTISGNKITAVNTTNSVSDNESQYYVDGFDADISSAVVGKDVSTASASRVGGASLTSNAFNNALITIVKNATA